MIVMKFGGTSVGDAAAMRNVSRIVRRARGSNPLVVASACAGITNALLSLARGVLDGHKGKSLDQVEAIRLWHRKIAHDLFSGDVLLTVQSQIDAMLDEVRDLVRSIAILGELTPRSLDTFASFGEKLSTLILYHQFVQDGTPAVLINAQEVVVTNSDFTRAVPLTGEIAERARTIIRPRLEQGQVVLTQGFLGATRTGVPTTIGRGGSDYSAALLGAVLGAEEIQIWTDVDGVMTCDPALIADARLIRELSFREAAELAYFGARVLHPATIQPAVQKNIPVRVLNSLRPDVEGTVIVREAGRSEASTIRAIAYKAGITLINITSTRMLMMHGFLARVFEVFAKFQKSVDVIATSEVSLSMTVDDITHLEDVLTELRQFSEVETSGHKAIFCVVGEHLKGSPGMLTRLFAALDRQGIRVGLISLGASEVNVTFVVDEPDVPATAHALHNEFFPS